MSGINCPKYTPEELERKPPEESGEFLFINPTKKELDFSKLQMSFEDSENLPDKEREALLKKIQSRIECDMNLTLLEARSLPNKKNYSSCKYLVGLAIKYNMNISEWQEEIDTLFPIQVLRKFEFSRLTELVKQMQDYIRIDPKMRNGFEYWQFSFQHTHVRQYYDSLKSLGLHPIELDQLINPILTKFLGVYLHDMLEVAQLFLEKKTSLFIEEIPNQVTEWKRNFQEGIHDYSSLVGNTSSEVLIIQQGYNRIIEAMNQEEAEIDMARKKDSERNIDSYTRKNN